MDAIFEFLNSWTARIILGLLLIGLIVVFIKTRKS
jgi:hypothetical protein